MRYTTNQQGYVVADHGLGGRDVGAPQRGVGVALLNPTNLLNVEVAETPTTNCCKYGTGCMCQDAFGTWKNTPGGCKSDTKLCPQQPGGGVVDSSGNISYAGASSVPGVDCSGTCGTVRELGGRCYCVRGGFAFYSPGCPGCGGGGGAIVETPGGGGGGSYGP